MMYRMINETRVCEFCYFEQSVEDHEDILECDSCGCDFCVYCFAESEGQKALDDMLAKGGPFLCP